MPLDQYPHLPFIGVEVNRARLMPGFNPSPQTEENKRNRGAHAERLRNRLDHLNAWWGEQKEQREADNLPEQEGIPLWVRIDPKDSNADFLRSMGFEIVSEEEDGYVLVAANDETFVVSGQKLDEFVDTERTRNGRPASVYEIGQPETQGERIQRILPDDLRRTWQALDDNQIITVDLSISCDVKQPTPQRFQGDDEAEDHYRQYLDNRHATVDNMMQQFDGLQRDRETLLERYLSSYDGEILDCYENSSGAEFPDSFTVRISISGQGFKDIVQTFPYLFQVECLEKIAVDGDTNTPEPFNPDVTIVAPADGAPSVCVVDSGIQEGHRLLEPGINSEHSFNFIPGDDDSDTADYVAPVGHGTQVAGNVLYPDSIPELGEFELAGFVQNARILNAENQLPESVMPALYLDEIVSHYCDGYNTRIFNHSINGAVPYRSPHMSTWAAAIDKISYVKNVLIVQSVGNILCRSSTPIRFGVQNHIQAGRVYPDYLHELSCRLANPAQSFHALSVGSVSDIDFNDGYRTALAGADRSSAFSRVGPGIWGAIKPEVVEVGGDLVVSDTAPIMVSQHAAVAPVMVQSTLHGQPAVGQHSVGTSFATPRVAGLALQLQALMPDETALLYRALIANSARWPDWAENNPCPCSVLHRIGYGRPDHERALGNDPHRVTLVVSDQDLCAREAKLFRVPVPDNLRAVESSYDVRIDVTLSYAAMPRRTRQGHRQYLSCRLDWTCSAQGQTEDAFRNDLFVTGDDDRSYDAYFPWKLRNRDNHGEIKGASRNRGSLQKDWAIVKSHDLPEDFLIGVVGHPGWDNANQYPANFALVVSFEAVNNDIEIYEDVRVLVDQMRVQEQANVEIPVDEF